MPMMRADAPATQVSPAVAPRDVVQVDPDFSVRAYAGAFVYVHEVFSWGVAGVVMAPKRHGEKPNPLGVTVPNGHFARVGPARWEAPPPSVPVVDLPEGRNAGMSATVSVGAAVAGEAGM